MTSVPGIEDAGPPRRRYPCLSCGGERLSKRSNCLRCGSPPRRPKRSQPREGTPDTVAAVAADLRDAAMRLKVYVSPGADTPDECEYLTWRLRHLAGRLDRLAGSPAGRRAIVPRRGPMPAAPLRDQSGDMS